MTTATLRKAVKKIEEAFSPNEGDDKPILYYVDQRILNDWERRYNPLLTLGSKFLQVWNRITRYPIEDMVKFEHARKDPNGLYRQIYKEMNESKFQQLAGLDIDITSLIRLPADFDTVVAAANDLNRRNEDWRADYFMIEGEELVMTDVAYEKRNRKAYHIASTREEKRNLRIAEGLIEAVEKLAEAVPAEKKIGMEALKAKKYVHPLPNALKLINEPSGWRLIPSPMWVKNGFKGTAILGFNIPTDQEIEFRKQDNNRLGPRIKKIQVIGENGLPTGHIHACPPEDVDKFAWGPARVNRNIVLPGYFNMEGKPYGTPLKGDTAIGASSSLMEKALNHIKVD